MKLILGVDPGSHCTGWAFIQKNGLRLSRVESGTIHLPSSAALSARLALLQTELEQILERILPQAVAVEDIFAHRNVRSALALGQARGVVLATVGKKELEVYAYPPATVKLSVSGYGRAEKSQIQRMVQVILSLPEIPPNDEADAMAVAICHALSKPDLK